MALSITGQRGKSVTAQVLPSDFPIVREASLSNQDHWINQRGQSGKHLGSCVMAYREATGNIELAIATGDDKGAAWFFPSGIGARGEKGDTGEKGDKGDTGDAGVSPVLQDSYLLDVYGWDGSTTVAAGAVRNLSTLSLSKTLDNGASSETGAGFRLPPKSKTNGLQVVVRLTGTTGSNSALEWRVQIRRQDGTTIVSSVNATKVAGVTDINNREVTLNSYTNGANDPFSTDGFQVVIHNTTGTAIKLTSAAIRVSRILNP